MVRIATFGTATLGALVLALVGNCSKADPAIDTAPPPPPGGKISGGAKGGPGSPGSIGGGVETARGGGAEGAQGADGADTSFKLTTEQASAGSAGAEVTARLVVLPGAGYHMNKDFPTKLTLEPPAGVTLSKTVLEPADAERFTDDVLAFAVKMTATAAGEYTIPGTFKFAVCTETTCDPKKQKVALVLKAN